MRNRKRNWRRSLPIWLFLGTICISAFAIGNVGLLQLLSSRFSGTTAGRQTFLALSFFSTAGIVGAAAGLFNYHINEKVSRLTQGLEAVAEGDYSVRLDPPQGGPLAQAYENFNKMGEELQSVQTLRKDFINNFSHEFKTPITAIQGFAELLQEPGLTLEDGQQYVQIILEESSRLAGLADSALLLTRLESLQVLPDQKPYALDEQIKRCAILLSSQWEKKRIAFSADLEEITFTGNEELMNHVWLNLLNNAIKYTPEGGEIAVSLRREEDEAVVTLSDTGAGMDEETRKHIFDKYYQGDTGSRSQGLGLGLSIVNRIVELCGGSIQVQSQVNQGSAFTVRLPLEA